MIRVLNIIGSLKRDGAETFLLNLYRNIDRTKVQFDFLVYNKPDSDSYYEEIIQLGGVVYVVPHKKDGFFKNQKEIYKVIKNNLYDIVWRHAADTVAGFDLVTSKVAGASTRILHSHASTAFGKKKVLHYLLKPFTSRISNVHFACGEKAGKWMFGNGDYKVIKNGLSTERFSYNEEIRREYRKKYNLENKLVIGHVGRFYKVKNHAFLIDLIKESKKIKKDIVLVLVGDGELKKDIEKRVEEKGVSDRVLMLGSRCDIPELLWMMDILLLPSFSEGFPVTLVEAQAAGLPCLVSDSISKETNIYGGVTYLSIDDKYCWLREIEKLHIREKNATTKMKENGFEIKMIAKEILEMLREVKK